MKKLLIAFASTLVMTASIVATPAHAIIYGTWELINYGRVTIDGISYIKCDYQRRVSGVDIPPYYEYRSKYTTAVICPTTPY